MSADSAEIITSAGPQRAKLSTAVTFGVFVAGTAMSYSPIGLALGAYTNAGDRTHLITGLRSRLFNIADTDLEPIEPALPLGERVATFKAESGLTWSQVAQLFAVSPRSVHLWVAGGRMTARHEERLATLAARLAEVPSNSAPEDVRSRLLAAQGAEPSLFAAWLLEVRPKVHAEGFAPGDLFPNPPDEPYQAAGVFEKVQKVDWPGVT